MLPLAIAPDSLRPSEGKAPFGRYLGPLTSQGIREWDAARSFRRRFQRKSWIYAGGFTKEYIVGIAIADAGYMALAFTYVFERSSGKYVEESTMRPFGFPRRFLPGLREAWDFSSGKKHWGVTPSEAGWAFRFEGKRIRLELAAIRTSAGLTAIAPSLRRPFHSTFKLAGIGMEGSLELDGTKLELTDALGAIDFSLGYPARKTFWHWACLAGRTGNGKRVGINLVAHFNDGLENALWIDDDMIPLGPAKFVPGEARAKDPWHITTENGELDLKFFPEGKRSQNLWLGPLQSRYVQPFGRFEGWVKSEVGDNLVRGLGVVEEHYALW